MKSLIFNEFRVDFRHQILVIVLFHFPWRSLMDVTHHTTEFQFKKNVLKGTWDDYETESHIAKTFTVKILWILFDFFQLFS